MSVIKQILIGKENLKGKMIKNILKLKKESDTYVTHAYIHSWSRQITIKVDYFYCDLSAPAMSSDMSQVGVALFPSF